MAGDEHDHDQRITDAVRHLAGDDRRLDAPPPELWTRIAGALDEADDVDGPIAPPPPDLWGRIADEVRSLGGQPDAPDDPVGPSAAPAAPTRPARRRWPIVAVAAAAAVLLIVAVVAGTSGRRSGGREVVARADLAGDGLDPGGPGSGTAQLRQQDGAWAVAIRAADLPDPAPGTYYEAWLLGSGPDQVQSLGALEGTGEFVVPDGLDLADFPLVDVSIEPIDGNPAHSAKSVLRGELEPT